MREVRQEQAARAYLDESDGRSIINACPRFGKIRSAIMIMKELRVKFVLILAPRKDIYIGWQSEFNECDAWPASLNFVTFASIKKLSNSNWDLVIIDEPHEMSVNQQVKLAPLVKDKRVLGLTGTMTQKTRTELYDNLNLDVCYRYSIADGVNEGILTDYEMFIHKIPLDTQVMDYSTKKRMYTEKGYFDLWTEIRKKAKKKHFIDMRRINIIQNSLSKLKKTRELLDEFENQRILVFCGVTKIADKLGIPVYHSKAREKAIFDGFRIGRKYNKLATIKMMQAGVTVLPINKGIINYMSGNPEDSAQKICRFLGLEYDNPNKKAEIHIVTTDETFELERLKTGLLFFDNNKISYID